MTNDDQQILDFIQQQLAWVAAQELILAKIEGKLRAMRELAACRLAKEMTFSEVQQLNATLEKLQQEVQALENELDKSTLH